MEKILVLGAGKSSSVLIRHLAENARNYHYNLLVADANQTDLTDKILHLSNVETFCGNLSDTEVLKQLILQARVVVSLLPPAMHVLAARLCLEHGRHFLTASYLSPEIKALNYEVKEKKLCFLMECGLDPGLDHMSAMRTIHQLQKKDAHITGFYSYCGGLITPASDDNPWGYKITWNPRNVVLAGQGTAKYLENGKEKYLPYQQLFKHVKPLEFEKYGFYEAYMNRDSLSYIDLYGLSGVQDFIRGTIRKAGFCKAWDLLVTLGLTDNSFEITEADTISIENLIHRFLPSGKSLPEHLGSDLNSAEWTKLQSLLLNSEERLINRKTASPADFLQALIEKRWKLKENDLDLVLMQHVFEYKLDGKLDKKVITFSLEGTDQKQTAMATTVGLPLAIAALHVYSGKFQFTGVHVPILEEIYNPILKELHQHGIIFGE